MRTKYLTMLRRPGQVMAVVRRHRTPGAADEYATKNNKGDSLDHYIAFELIDFTEVAIGDSLWGLDVLSAYSPHEGWIRIRV